MLLAVIIRVIGLLADGPQQMSDIQVCISLSSKRVRYDCVGYRQLKFILRIHCIFRKAFIRSSRRVLYL